MDANKLYIVSYTQLSFLFLVHLALRACLLLVHVRRSGIGWLGILLLGDRFAHQLLGFLANLFCFLLDLVGADQRIFPLGSRLLLS